MEQLSNAELAELFLIMESAIYTQFEYWLTITFAVVVAAFVAGKRLNRNLRFALALHALASVRAIGKTRGLSRAQKTAPPKKCRSS